MGWARCGRTLCVVFLVVLVGVANGDGENVTRTPNKEFPCPDYNGPNRGGIGLEDGSNSRIDKMTFKFLVGCNPKALKEKLQLDPKYTRYRMLQKYYINEINDTLNNLNKPTARARRVPLCVRSTKLSVYKAQMGNFQPIIEQLEEKENEYKNKGRYDGDPPIWYPRQEEGVRLSTDTDFGVEDIRMTRIYTGDPKMPLLRQWFHMAIYMREQIWEGIYVQAISAPMGLPFGEFRQDFECENPSSELVDREKRRINHSPGPLSYYEDILVFPCSYRARYHIRHPNVFTVGGRPGTAKRKYHEFHIHFNWIDATCYEATAMQFLIVLVKSFENREYNVFYTPALNHTYLDSNDGLPYPLYPGWKADKTISCNGESIPMYDEVSQEFINKGKIQPPVESSAMSYDMPGDRGESDFFEDPARNDEKRKDLKYGDFYMDSDLDSLGDAENGGKENRAATFFVAEEKNADNIEVNSVAEEQNAENREVNSVAEEQNAENREVNSVAEEQNAENREVNSVADDKDFPDEVKGESPNQNIERRGAEPKDSTDDQVKITLTESTASETSVAPEKKDDKQVETDTTTMSDSTMQTNTPRIMKKNQFDLTKPKSTELRGNSSFNWLRRKKRETAKYPKVPSKCTDRNACIMGQFQIVRKDVAIIEYNKQYDDCVLSGKGVTPHVPLECPPDAVTCHNYITAIHNNPDNRQKFRTEMLSKQMCNVCTFPDDSEMFRSELPPEIPIAGPTKAGMVNERGEFMTRPVPMVSLMDIGFRGKPVLELFPNGSVIPTTTPSPNPPTTTVETTTEIVTTTSTTTEAPPPKGVEPDAHIPVGRLLFFDRLVIYKNQMSKMSHGGLMLYSWFFLVPAANFAARYYKESGGIKGNGMCGMPTWLISHIGLYVYAFLCMGVGVINVSFLVDLDCDRVPITEDKQYCDQNHGELVSAHVIFGGLAFFFLLPQHLFGWLRPLSENIRWLIQIIHSCGGYVAYILAAISLFMTQTCVEIYIEAVLMIGIHVALFCVGCVVQIVQDKKLGLRENRKVFPVLEVVEIRENPPQDKAKKILQWIHDLALGVLSVLLLITYNKITQNDPHTDLMHKYDDLNNQTRLTLEFDGLIIPNSCSRTNFVYLFQQIACNDAGINATKVTFWCNNPKNETI